MPSKGEMTIPSIGSLDPGTYGLPLAFCLFVHFVSGFSQSRAFFWRGWILVAWLPLLPAVQVNFMAEATAGQTSADPLIACNRWLMLVLIFNPIITRKVRWDKI